MNLILCFFYVFSFSFNNTISIDSSMIVAVYLMYLTVIKPGLFKEFMMNLRKKYFMNILTVYLILNLLALYSMLINMSNDFSFLKTFFHMFYYVIEGIWLYSYYKYKNCEKNITNYIIMAFIIQTIIQWSAFLIPGFKAFLNITKSNATIAKGIEYGGVRANALSGSDFFGLSAAYALVFILYLSEKNTILKNNRPLKLLLYIFIVTGTFFAGRTGYIGLLISIVYYTVNEILLKRKRTIRLSEICTGVIAIGAIINIISVFIDKFRTTKIYKSLFKFTFQMLFNKIERGTFSVSSFSYLINNMYFSIPFSTLLIGDAKYTTNTKHYYMSTDSGYLRPILFFGIIGFIVLIFMQFLIVDIKHGREKFLKVFIMIAYFVISIKGEMFVWNCIPLTITILFSLQDRTDKFYLKKGELG